MTFFDDLLKLYSDDDIDIPDVKPLEKGLGFITTILAISKNDQHPIADHMECLAVVRAADYLGADGVLGIIQERLQCSSSYMSNATDPRVVRKQFRNRYRKTKKKVGK